MNQEVKKRWIDALRSGDYKQGAGCLRIDSSNRFCCLGVLTDLYFKEKNCEWDPGLSLLPLLPDRIVQWAELADRNPGFLDENDDVFNYFTSLNDQVNMSFKQIADLIEEHL